MVQALIWNIPYRSVEVKEFRRNTYNPLLQLDPPVVVIVLVCLITIL